MIQNPMQPEERQFVLDHLAKSQAHILRLVEPLTPAQWHFHESPERWSIAENIEHCILTEHAVTGIIQGALAKPAQPEKMAEAPGKEGFVKRVSTPSPSMRLVAMEPLQPTGRWPDSADLIQQFNQVREQSVAFTQASEQDLRSHFYPHQALGDLDCYQWLIVLAQHAGRHAHQIEAVQASPAYPQA